MCLTVPKKVISVDKKSIKVSSNKKGRQEVGSIVNVKQGDWVLTQNNIIIQKLSPKQAKEINKIFST
jgi:hydrogenase maturation factor